MHRCSFARLRVVVLAVVVGAAAVLFGRPGRNDARALGKTELAEIYGAGTGCACDMDKPIDYCNLVCQCTQCYPGTNVIKPPPLTHSVKGGNQVYQKCSTTPKTPNQQCTNLNVTACRTDYYCNTGPYVQYFICNGQQVGGAPPPACVNKGTQFDYCVTGTQSSLIVPGDNNPWFVTPQNCVPKVCGN